MPELVLQIPVVAERSPASRTSSQSPTREAVEGTTRQVTEGTREPDQQGSAERGGEVQQVKEVEKAVEEVNEALVTRNISLLFSVDEAANRVVVKVTDRDTGDLIRQIPPEVQLRVAGHIRELLGILLNEKA